MVFIHLKILKILKLVKKYAMERKKLENNFKKIDTH